MFFKRWMISTFSMQAKKAALIALFIGASSLISQGQLILGVDPATPQTVDTGSEACFEIEYGWSSVTENIGGAQVVVTLPTIFGGASPSDFNALTINPQVSAISFDPLARELVFEFIDPLPAGSSGILDFCVTFPNGSTLDNQSETIAINFGGDGQPSVTQNIDVTSNASSQVELLKGTVGDIEPAQGETTPYQIVVNNNQGPGNYDQLNAVVTDVLPPGATFLGSNPAPTSVVIDDQGTVGNPSDDVTTVTWNYGTIPAGAVRRINLTVQYDDVIGTMVTNNATLTGQNPDGASVMRSVVDTRTVVGPNPNASFSKSRSTSKVSLSTDSDDVTETIFYSFNIQNTGNVALPNYVVEDSFPAGFFPTRLLTGFDQFLFQQNNVQIEYQLAGSPGVWVPHPDNPFLSPVQNDPLIAEPQNNEVDLTILGDAVIAVRWTHDTLPVGYDNNANARVYGEYRAPAVAGTTVTNAGLASQPNDTALVTVSSTRNVEIVAPSPRPQASKSIIGPTIGGPTDIVTYRIEVSNSLGASVPLDSPVATDLLPEFMTFVPGSVTADPPLTQFSAGTDGTTGRPLLTFDWTGQSIAVPTTTPNPGLNRQGSIEVEVFVVEFQVQVDPGTTEQDLINTADLTYSNPVINDSSGSPDQTGPIIFSVVDTGILSASKYVLGDLDLPSQDPDDLDFGDGDNDQTFETRFPEVSQIMPGGQMRYRIDLFNPGNEPLDNIRIMEILPFVGDIGVVSIDEDRGSAWSPFLIQHSSQTSVFPDAIKYDINNVASTAPVAVQWSTSTNPVRSELDVVLGDPSSGDSGTFNASPLPADLSTVKSLILEFPTLTLNPLERLEFYFYLQAPIDAPAEEAAWNSIGRRAEVVSTGLAIPTVEPLKVGVVPSSVSLGNYVFIDSTLGMPSGTDSNGIQDPGENPLPGATVTVFQYIDGVLSPAPLATGLGSGSGGAVPAVVTDSTGSYFFDDLVSSGTTYDGVLYGDFVVQVTPPSTQYQQSPISAADPNNDDNTDNNGSLTVPPGGLADPGGNTLWSGDINLTFDGEPTDDDEALDPSLDDNSNASVDFGFIADQTQIASIGDFVWKDTNFDGLQVGENGVAGATVSLLMEDPSNPGTYIAAVDSHGNAVANQVTAADGAYNFDDLLVGNYQVVVNLPAGFGPTPSSGTNNSDSDTPGDADGTWDDIAGTLTSDPISLTAGEVNDTVDFGLVEPLSLGDFIWIDDQPGTNANDQNGTFDPGENPLQGATVELFVEDPNNAGSFVEASTISFTDVFGQPITSFVTGVDGRYLFEGLPAGNYQVRVVPPGDAAYLASPFDADPDNDTNNTDSNGIPFVGGVPVASGLAFDYLQSGTVNLTTDNEPLSDGQTIGQDDDGNMTVDFGVFTDPVDVVGIGNSVWIDANNDGIQDDAENPLAGAVVALVMEDPANPGTFIPAFDSFGNVVGTQTTGADGLYSFSALLPNILYKVQVTPPSFYVGASPSAADSDLNTTGDNDAKPVVGESYWESDPVLLTPDGEPVTDGGRSGTDTDGALDDNNINQTIDFGFTPDPAAVMNLGDLVFLDGGGNGRSNNGNDDPLPGATVQLLVADPNSPGDFITATDHDGNPIASQVTGADGLYNFGDLLPGDYHVRVTPPADHAPTRDGVGNDDLTDSEGQGYNANGNLIGEPNIANPNFAYSQSPVITLTPGAAPIDDGDPANGDLSVDFGFWTPVSIGDTVWLDNGDDGAGGTTPANVNNGLLDSGEVGIADVVVHLFRGNNPDFSGTSLATTTTDSNGNYLFEGLSPGAWSVYIPSSEFQPGEPLDSLLSSTGNGAALDPDTATPNLNTDDNGDPANGGTELTDGVAAPGIGLIIGGEPTTDGDSDPDTNLTVDFGFIDDSQLVNLGDVLWNDLDNDGLLNGSEVGIDGVTIQLFPAGADPSSATPLRTEITANGGQYDFDNLPPGDYFVYIPPSEFDGGSLDGFLSSNGGGAATDPDNDLDGDDNGDPFNGGTEAVDGVSSQVITLTLTGEPGDDDTIGDTNNTLDLGVYDPATLVSLGDALFLDDGGTNGVSNNGIRDGDEVGIGGVTVQLFEAGADPLTATPIRTTTSSPSGEYLFADIPPGDYQVYLPASQFEAGGELEELASSNGNGLNAPDPDDNADDDDNGTPFLGGGVISGPITLTVAGEPTTDGDDANGNLTLDFGFTPKVSLGDTLFSDFGGTSGEGNGFQDGGETGISDVVVELFETGADPLTASPVAVTSTTGTGGYFFDNLAPGDYFVYIPAAEFAPGEPLAGLASSAGNGVYAPDPDDDFQGDDNGTREGSGGVVTLPITLTVGGETADDALDSDPENNSTLDLGFVEAVSLGDTVWLDANNNGVLDGTEAGIPSVTVQLFPAGVDPTTAAPVAVTGTGSAGEYQFNNLAPGDYFVYIPQSELETGGALDGLASSDGNGVTAPSPDGNVQDDDNGSPNLTFGGISTGVISLTRGGETSDDAFDSDPNNNSTVDLGFTPAVSLGDFIWADTDNSGTLDGSETGIADVVLFLFPDGADVTDPAQAVATTTSGPTGAYNFTNLPPGDYVVYIPPTEFTAGEPLEGLASSNGNGNQSPDPDDNTDGDDNGDLEDNGGVVSGPITLTVGAETGDGDLDPNRNASLDFGFTDGVSLGDVVWLDSDNSGFLDGLETGMAGVAVELFEAGSDPLVADPILSTVTDASGNYLFANLVPGDYFVFLPDGTELAGLVSSTGNGQATDPDDDVNSDNNGVAVTGGYQSGEVTLIAGNEPDNDGDSDQDSNLALDFGFTDPTNLVSVGDTVWGDTDNSGTLNGAEVGIPGVVVELYDVNNPNFDEPGVDPPFFTTTTGPGGSYDFSNLNPGDYLVYLPSSNFGPGAILENLSSSSGNGAAPDPDNDSDGDDNGDPDVLGGIVSAPITLTTGGEPGASNSNATLDFGVTFAKSANLADYFAANAALFGLDDNTPAGQAATNPLTGDPTGATDLNGDDFGGGSGLAGNADGDIFNNLMEFALCMDPGSGAKVYPNGTPNRGFHLELNGSSLDAQFTQPTGVTDVTYEIEVSTDGQTWNTLTGMTPVTSSGPVPGSSIVSYQGIDTSNPGLLRLKVTGTGAVGSGVSAVTPPIGWQTATVKDFCQTYADAFLEPCLVTGGITGVSGQVLDLTQAAGSQGITSVLDPARSYYLEIVGGDQVGHVFDIVSFTGNEVTLATQTDLCGLAAPYSTRLDVPSDLASDQFVIREHKTLESLFPIDDVDTAGTVEGFAAGTNLTNSGVLLRYDRSDGGMETYVANSIAGANGESWVGSTTGAGAPGNILPPGEGIFVHNLSGQASFDILQFGEARTTRLAVPLCEGYNFVAPTHPLVSQSIDGPVATSRLMNNDSSGGKFAFGGSGARSLADQIQVWSDDTAGTSADVQIGYRQLFYLRNSSGSVDQWSDGGDSTATARETAPFFNPTRSAMYCIQEDDMPSYYIPSPINNSVN